jgi:hypothetical protein
VSKTLSAVLRELIYWVFSKQLLFFGSSDTSGEILRNFYRLHVSNFLLCATTDSVQFLVAFTSMVLCEWPYFLDFSYAFLNIFAVTSKKRWQMGIKNVQ